MIRPSLFTHIRLNGTLIFEINRQDALRQLLFDTMMSNDRRPRYRLEANPRPRYMWSSGLPLDHDQVIGGLLAYH